MTTEYRNRPNAVRAIGILDAQRLGRQREETTLTQYWNGVQGIEHGAMLQVRSPFGTPFQLPLRFDSLVEGRELLASSMPGDPLCAEGTLEWTQREDTRYALSPTERGRRITEIIFRPQRITPVEPDDEPGCDVWLEGVVRRGVRRYTHPDRRVPIAVIGLEVLVERTRRNSQARLIEPVEVQVAIPLDHEHLPNLMRQGNWLTIEGMLERVVVPLRSEDQQVQAAVQALDQSWRERQSDRMPNRQDERRYARQRQRLQQTIVTRVVAGYVRLLEGEPASLEEAQELRQARRRQRAEDQQVRREAEIDDDAAPAGAERRPRRRSVAERQETPPAREVAAESGASLEASE